VTSAAPPDRGLTPGSDPGVRPRTRGAAPEIDIEAFWEYSDPGASEGRFREALAGARGDERLELLTQVARTHSLRKDFAAAHKLLDEVEPQLANAGPRPRIRYLLERGRTFNSAGEKEKARELFERAWALAGDHGEEGLAVDAAHMVAIARSGTPESIEWNRKGLAIANESKFAKARALIPAIYNNLAWELYDAKRFDEALPVFEKALEAWTATGKPKQIQVAKWSVAQCLKALGRRDEGERIERALEAEGYKP